MTIRQLKLLCWTVCGLLAAGAVAVIVLATAIPMDVTSGADEAETHVTSRSNASTTVKLTMMDFEQYLSGTLRAAPQVAPVVVQAPVAAPAPVQVSDFQLMGTITEKDNSVAIIKAGENVEFKKLGEKINDAEVTEISEGVAVLKRNGESMTLRVPLPPG
jgi:hypothetical protein